MGRLKKLRYYRIFTVPTVKGYKKVPFVAYSSEDAVSLAKVLCRRERDEARERAGTLPLGSFRLLIVGEMSSGRVIFEDPKAAELMAHFAEQKARRKERAERKASIRAAASPTSCETDN